MAWVKDGSIRGPKGDPGASGATGASGASGPMGGSITFKGEVLDLLELYDVQNPQPGDAYVDSQTGLLHVYQNGGWTQGLPWRGPMGPRGASGASGASGIPGATGPAGATGATGAAGASGAAATITVGTVTTGLQGTNAAVTNGGTTTAARLDFTIPRGASGAPGTPGASGAAATIAVGTVTTGAQGTNAVITNVGTASAATFNFTIPRGASGAPGTPGGQGPAGPTLPDLVLGQTGTALTATGLKLWTGTAAQYAALATKSATTVYIVTP